MGFCGIRSLCWREEFARAGLVVPADYHLLSPNDGIGLAEPTVNLVPAGEFGLSHYSSRRKSFRTSRQRPPSANPRASTSESVTSS